MINNPSQETLDALKKAQSEPSANLSKSITVGTGLVAYDLQAPAKNLYPHTTPIRNVLPRIGGGTGTGSNWRQINAIIGSGVPSMPWVPEGQRAALMSYSTSSKSSTYMTIGEDDNITFEAINAARTFEDLRASMAFRLLQKMMEKEEFALIGGNGSILLGTPGTPTVSAVTDANSTLPSATYKVQVVALTYEGYYAVKGNPANPIVTQFSAAGADGETITLNGGSSNLSPESSGQAVTAGTSALGMKVAAVQGAVAYAWYVSSAGGTGDETLQLITTTNWAVLRVPLVGSRQAASAITSDHSRNTTLAFDGLLTNVFTTGSGAYLKTMDTGTVGTGTPLTASGVGGVTEIDDMLQSMWDNYQVSPTVMYVNSQEMRNITKKVLSNASSPLLRYTSEGGEYHLTGSGSIEFYYNPFLLSGGQKMPVLIHPNIPPGTILAWADNLPAQYQSNNVPNVAQVKERQGYYQVDWPVVTRKQGIGVYSEEVLEVYAPFALGAITNIANG